MQESEGRPAKPFVSFWRKTGIIFLLALVAGGCFYFLENSGWPQDSSGWSRACASILGAALFYFVVAMVFAAWIKGIPGVVVGSLIIAGLSFLVFQGEYPRHESQQKFIGTLQKDQQQIQDSFKEHNDQFGGGTTDLKKMDSLLADLKDKDKTKDLDPQDKAAVEGMTAVMDRLMKLANEARPLSDEIFSQKFQDVSSIRTIADIDERLGKIEALRSTSRQMLSMCQNMDVTLKTELARRKLPATYINGATASFMKAAHMEITLSLGEINVELAELMSRRFSLLKQEFGHWYVKNQLVCFAHSKPIEQWNNDLREYFQLAEKRESLTRQLAGTPGN
jgi:hypothetical protein